MPSRELAGSLANGDAPPPGAAGSPMDVPADYYRRIFEVEERHPWHRGMVAISAALLEGHRVSLGGSILDAGCGTGGFLRWAQDRACFERICGIDIGAEAVAMAKRRVPDAQLHVAPLKAVPFESESFHLVVTNDVLQHVPEGDLEASLVELYRVLRPGGALVVRTNGARRARRDRPDWRLYDRAALAAALAGAAFRCERVTYVNMAGSLLAAARGRTPSAPDEHRHGIPALPGPTASALSRLALAAESTYLRHAPRRAPSIPYGHSLLALATRP